MNLHKLHDGMGQTGRFGEFFLVLGTIVLLGGVAMIVAAATGWGPALDLGDAITTGGLFIVMGGGFAGFGVMVMMAGWGRHHPEYEDKLP